MTKLVRNPIDALVGANVKKRRSVMSMSQTELARRLDLTFQQVQKYEKGANRIGASRLYLIAQILHVPVESLYEGAEALDVNVDTNSPGARQADEIAKFADSPSGVSLLSAMARMDSDARKKLIALAQSIAPKEPALSIAAD